MKNKMLPICIALMLLSIISCNNKTAEKQTVIIDSEIINTQVLTQDQQKKLIPTDVITSLKAGNKEFVEDQLTVRNNSTRVRQASLGQFPKAVILSCLDSRVPVEDVFHKGIGDLFVARVAGNIINEDILGSLEYACKVSGSKVIVVLGHEHCGAVKSAIDSVQLGNITLLLNKIQPAVQKAKSTFQGETSSKNEKFVQTVCEDNVRIAIDQIRTQSHILNHCCPIKINFSKKQFCLSSVACFFNFS